ncbi:hypothetical protein LguiA_025049 [Lonicera macranthoides]
MIRLLQARLASLSCIPLNSLPPSFCRAHGRSSIHVAEVLQDLEDVSTNRKILNGFRTFCTGKDLSIKKCVPCNSKDLGPMTEEAVPEWTLVNEGGMMKLHRSWKVKSFTKGLEFFEAVASVAEAEGHHPDLHLVGWNNVKIDIWTHAVGGLTENDFILAAKIGGLNLHHLLRKVAKKNE